MNRRSWSSLLTKEIWIAGAMGFVSGLPLLLTGSVLQAWMTDAGVDLSTISLFGLVSLPYSVKFLWAPFFDRFIPNRLGRRRGWLLLAQLALMGALVFLAANSPQNWLLGVVLASFLVAFFSASQDIVVDAYRRESLAEDQQGAGASFYVTGYRIGILLASGGGLILADYFTFPQVYLLMAAFMLIGVATTLFAPEPDCDEKHPLSLKQAILAPMIEYFSRRDALLILLFIVLYKLGDNMASHLTTPFYLQLGFSKSEIGAVVKLFGFWASIFGGFLGGVLSVKLGLYRALWMFGVLQAVSTAGFALLAQIGADTTALAAVIAFENLSGGMGTAVFVAYLATQTDVRFTATQYALLSSLLSIPRTLLAAPAGFLVEAIGWYWFFIFCALVAIPGILLIRLLWRRDHAAKLEIR